MMQKTLISEQGDRDRLKHPPHFLALNTTEQVPDCEPWLHVRRYASNSVPFVAVDLADPAAFIAEYRRATAPPPPASFDVKL
jgi:hypothetical protein